MAGIIKAGNWKGGSHDVQSTAFNFEDISEKAQAYLDSVRRRAEQVLENAQQNAQQVELQAKQQGQQAALREAQTQVQASLDERLATLMPALSQAIEGIHRERESWLRHWEQRTVTLAVAIAEKVIRREVETKPDITLDLVKEALELAVGGGTIKLFLNPEDYRTLGDRAGSSGDATGQPCANGNPGRCRGRCRRLPRCIGIR